MLLLLLLFCLVLPALLALEQHTVLVYFSSVLSSKTSHILQNTTCKNVQYGIWVCHSFSNFGRITISSSVVVQGVPYHTVVLHTYIRCCFSTNFNISRIFCGRFILGKLQICVGASFEKSLTLVKTID